MAENVTIKCTSYCGFEVTADQEFAASLFEHHEHEDNPANTEGTHWYEYVFSWKTAILLLMLAVVVAAALDPHDFLKG